MNVESIATSYLAVQQARVQFAVAARLLRVANETGAQQTLSLVEQATQSASETLTRAAEASVAGLDTFG